MNVEELLQTIAERVSAGATVKNVYGDPVSVGERTVIPVAKVRYGFGGGGGRGPQGEREASGAGGGGGVTARPCGVFEVTRDATRFIPLEDRTRLAAALALGFVLGVVLVRFTRPKRIEVVKRSQ